MTPRPLRFGILTMQHPPWTSLVARWRGYEALGFDSVWVCDHFVGRHGEPMFEAWTLLAALAVSTERVRLGAAVTCASFRSAALLAAQAATLADVSGGRLEIGLGAGWWAEEHETYGFPFGSPTARVARFEETVAALVRRFGDGRPADASVVPPSAPEIIGATPTTAPPHPPLVLAAQGPRMLDVVARHADAWIASFGLSAAEVFARNLLLDDRCRALGRDPDEIRRCFLWAPWVQSDDPWASPAAFRAFVARYRAAGMTEFVFDEPRPEQRPILEQIAAEVLPELRSSGANLPRADRAWIDP